MRRRLVLIHDQVIFQIHLAFIKKVLINKWRATSWKDLEIELILSEKKEGQSTKRVQKSNSGYHKTWGKAN